MKYLLILLICIFSISTVSCGKESNNSTISYIQKYKDSLPPFLYNFFEYLYVPDQPGIIYPPIEGFSLYLDSQQNYYYVSPNDSKDWMIVYPGLGQNANQYLTDVYTVMTGELMSKGYKVIFVNLPVYTNPDHSINFPFLFNNHGTDYMIAFDTLLGQYLNYLHTLLGNYRTLNFGGVSFGGFHSMLSVCLTPHQSSFFFASVPATQLEDLFGHAYGDTNNEVVSDWCKPILASKQSVIQYGTADMRVDYLDTINLVNSMNSPLTTVVQEDGMSHLTTGLTTDNYMNFVPKASDLMVIP